MTSACLPRHPAVAYLFLVRPQPAPMKTTLFALFAMLALKSSLVASGEITRDHAHHLAAAYFARYVSGCGGVQPPSLRGDFWEAPVRFGYAGTPSGVIRVQRHTGVVSY